MPDIAALVTPPLLLDSTGAPANGDIFSRVTSTIAIGAGLVTPTQGHGAVVGGQFKALDGTAYNLPVTPEGVAVELFVELREERPDGRKKHTIRRTVSVPNETTVTWADLIDVIPVISDGDYMVPSWVTDLLDEAVAAAAPAIEARDEALAAQGAAETAQADAEAAKADAEGAAASVPPLLALVTPTNGARSVGKGELFINVKDYGATGNGTTDDAPAIQALIDATTAGVLYFPKGDYRIGAPIVIHSGIYLVGFRPGFGYLASGTNWTTRFRAIGALSSIITHTGTLTSAGVQGIDFQGNGTALRGISWTNATWCVIKDVHMNDFLDEFIYVDGIACVIENFLGVNGLRRAPAERIAAIGSINLGGSDHMLSRMQTGGGYTTGALTSGAFNAAFHIRATSVFATQLVGEFSEVGFRFADVAKGNRFTLCRADKGGAHGWIVLSSDNVFSACHSANMAREATNVYSGFQVSGSFAQGNSFSACRVHGTSGFPNVPKYAFEDSTTGYQSPLRTSWVGCTGIYATSMFKTVDHSGSAPVIPNHLQRYAANSTTYDVNNVGIVHLNANVAATTITAFTGGSPGQVLTVFSNNAFSTIQNNATIKTNTGADKAVVAFRPLRFTYIEGVWYEGA